MADQPEAPPVTPRSRAPLLLLIAIVLAAGLATLFWLDARNRIGATQEELARRLRDIEWNSAEARSIARQAQEAVRGAQVKVAQLEARLAESQSLQLAGNVRAALLALQLAEARLARADRPQFLPVRRALARDIERLKALPVLDVASMTSRIDGLIAAVD